MKSWSSSKISMFTLVLLITGAIDSIRNLPTTALFGPSLIFFFIVAALIFLIPVALVAAELSSTWPEEEGGVYSWVQHAYGENWAFLTIWLQWINTIIWYPTILSFIAGTLAYLINPHLADSKLYLIAVIIITFWSLTFLGLKGLRASATFASVCAIAGMILPMAFIILLALIWLLQGHPLAIEINSSTLLPNWSDTHSWASLTAIMTSFLGMELAAVHVRQVRNPQHNFPRAMYFSVLLILVTMILGSLAIAFVLPEKDIGLVDGVMQAFSHFFAAYHLNGYLPILIGLLLLGSLGSMVNWIISPAKGLLLAANHGFLPPALYRLNKEGVASRILILQAVLVTVSCTGFLLFPSINGIYWLFTDLSTELYILMYVIMFLAAFCLKGKFNHLPRPFSIPGGRIGYYMICFIGIGGCLLTLFIGFFPPVNRMDVGGSNHFRLVFSSCMFLMVLPAFLLLARKLYKERQMIK